MRHTVARQLLRWYRGGKFDLFIDNRRGYRRPSHNLSTSTCDCTCIYVDAINIYTAPSALVLSDSTNIYSSICSSNVIINTHHRPWSQ